MKKYLSVMCASEELQSLQIINNRMACATQALTPMSVPTGVGQDQIDAFVNAAVKAKADAQFLMSTWWKDQLNKHPLPKDKNVFVDFSSGEFYVIEEDKA